MFEIEYSNQFKSDLKKCFKRGLDIDSLRLLIENHLEQTGTVPEKHRPHILSGKYEGVWECHIESDWLLLWRKYDNTIQIYRTGTHSDFFKKKKK